jgi:hypothetical protein
MKYGLEGYGLYWYCLELIAADVDQHKLTFELEHDAEIIAFDTGIHYERVNEMMAYMVNLKLFEENNGVLSCLKLANRLDKSMTSNPVMRKMLEDIRNNHDKVMTKSDKPMQDKTRLEETRVDKNKQVSIVHKRISKPEIWKEFYRSYPETRRGGSDATAWNKAKAMKLTESDFQLMLDDVVNRKAFHSGWANPQYIQGITKYISEKLWLTPIEQASQSTDFSGQQSVSNWADGLANEFHGVNK